MSTLTTNRSDVFPVGTVVKAYAAPGRVTGAKPSGPSLAEATVDATGKLEITGLEDGRYVLAAEVGGVWRQLVADSRSFTERSPALHDRISRVRAETRVAASTV